MDTKDKALLAHLIDGEPVELPSVFSKDITSTQRELYTVRVLLLFMARELDSIAVQQGRPSLHEKLGLE